ncbi:hypothetical protein [Aurantiacibacter rhizosphaerae]|uniref:Uncharacterized protein n=1 Tax=Aurantiacibacter rhizosphaerae TaxID=2691582 RepID=A0A844X9K9_9SPHN|nr:hypothetical protein [Aurantiacibacter rhizosphaerae]MWV26442.1 hypothetical protein [Aurantiacibacter rhizosphaerae]
MTDGKPEAREARRVESDEARRYNLRALMALKGSSLSPQDDLIELLKTDQPINRLVRDRLIELLLGPEISGGMSLSLRGNKTQRDRTNAYVSRNKWFEIGQWIDGLTSQGALRAHAIEEVASAINISEKKADKSLNYYRAARNWIAKSLETECGAELGAATLRELYIFHDCQGDLAKELNSEILERLPPIGL